MVNLPQSVPDWCFLKEGVDASSYYARLKSLGYAGVEIVDPKRWDAARAAELSIVNLAAPGMQDGMNKESNRTALVAQIRECLSTASANGIPHVIVFSGNRQGQDDDEGLRHCTTVCAELARDAERLGVTLVFEMLNSLEHVDYMADHSRFGFALAEAVGSPRFKILYDIYHMFRMGEDVLANLLGHLDYIAHIHVAGSPRRDFPGTRQEIDYADIVKKVTAAGYTGFWGQEFLPSTDDPFTDLEAASMLFSRYAQA
jgi:hydroxypyruvate isomerase